MDLHINESVGIVNQSAMPIFEDKMPLNNKLVGILVLTSVVTCLIVAFTYKSRFSIVPNSKFLHKARFYSSRAVTLW